MFVYFFAGWAALIVICEIYMLICIKDSDGEPSQTDDDSRELTKIHAAHANSVSRSKRRAIRAFYIAVPALAALFLVVAHVMNGVPM